MTGGVCMYCPKCGEKIPDDSAFCTNCGARIADYMPDTAPEAATGSPRVPKPEPVAKPVPEPKPEPVANPVPEPKPEPAAPSAIDRTTRSATAPKPAAGETSAKPAPAPSTPSASPTPKASAGQKAKATPPVKPEKEGKRLSRTAIIGIVAACVVVVGLVAGILIKNKMDSDAWTAQADAQTQLGSWQSYKGTVYTGNVMAMTNRPQASISGTKQLFDNCSCFIICDDKVYYVEQFKGNGNSALHLYSANLDGSGKTELADNVMSATPVFMSYNQIVYQAYTTSGTPTYIRYNVLNKAKHTIDALSGMTVVAATNDYLFYTSSTTKGFDGLHRCKIDGSDSKIIYKNVGQSCLFNTDNEQVFYMNPKNSHVYRLNADGSVKWSAIPGAFDTASAAGMAKDGVLYYAANNTVYAVSEDTGDVLASLKPSSTLYFGSVFYRDGTYTYVVGSTVSGSTTSDLYSIKNSDGTVAKVQ